MAGSRQHVSPGSTNTWMDSGTEDELRWLLRCPKLFPLDEKSIKHKTHDARPERKQGLFGYEFVDKCWLETLRRQAALVAVKRVLGGEYHQHFTTKKNNPTWCDLADPF